MIRYDISKNIGGVIGWGTHLRAYVLEILSILQIINL